MPRRRATVGCTLKSSERRVSGNSAANGRYGGGRGL